MPKVRLFKPWVGREEISNIKKVFSNSWIGYGPEVHKFEKKFSKFIGTKYAVAVNSGTAALHLALLCNDFKKNKEVLVPSITFSATAASALYCGLKPKFVDIRKEDLTIDFEDIKKKYTKNCVALICVHMGGHPAQMEKIRPWAKKKKLLLIEDSAESCGSIYKGKKLGTWSDISCFSFEEKKIITTGDGGMICLNDKEKYEKIKSLSFHGWNIDPWKRHQMFFRKKNKFSKHWKYEITKLGYKYNMNDLTAAVGLAQLKKINLFNKNRNLILKKYLNGIKDLKYINSVFPYDLKNGSYWLFSVKTKFRDELINFLKKKNISTAVHFVPLPMNKLYKSYNSNNLKNTKIIWKEIVSLPFFPDLENKKIEYVIKCLRSFDKNLK
jgi:perosamine synthetase